uniref:EGF-like domain-containing protein n=1 Tax=Brugia timori TaxID=42155 RepID=A0A0R3QAX9_9BILA
MQRRRERKLDTTPILGNLCVDDTDCHVFNTYCGQVNFLELKNCKCKEGFFPSKDMTQCIQVICFFDGVYNTKNTSVRFVFETFPRYTIPLELATFSLSSEIFVMEWKSLLDINRSYIVTLTFSHNQISLIVDDFAPVVFKLPPAVISHPLKFDTPVYLGYTPVLLL